MPVLDDMERAVFAAAFVHYYATSQAEWATDRATEARRDAATLLTTYRASLAVAPAVAPI